MAYTAWTVTNGEQPTAAKWNQLGANDAGLRDGSNILINNNQPLYQKDSGGTQRQVANITAGDVLELGNTTLPTSIATNIKFHAHKSAGYNFTGSAADVVFDTESWDTGADYNNATGIFTAPVAGIYFFYFTLLGVGADGVRSIAQLVHNSTAVLTTSAIPGAAYAPHVGGCRLISMAASDTAKIQVNREPSATTAVSAGVGVHFGGFLLLKT